MPTYEYECVKCKRTFEVRQAMSDAPLKRCRDKSCRGPVKRLVSEGVGVIFKGGGFYATDYKGAKGGKSGNGSKSEKAAPCAAAESGACPSAGSCPAAKK